MDFLLHLLNCITMKESLEQSLLKLFVLFSVGYQCIQLTYDFLFTDYVLVGQLENVLTIFFYLLVLYQGHQSADRQVKAWWVYLIAAVSFTFEWLMFGGFASSTPYNAVLLLIIILISSRNKVRIWSASLFFVWILSLVWIDFKQWTPFFALASPPSVLTLTLDFLLHGLLITWVSLVLKQKFDDDRAEIGRQNEELRQLDQEIAQKNKELAQQQYQVRSLNANLEKRIELKVEEIREKNSMLAEYAYINAHHLRGPVCKIMSLAELMEEATPEDTALAGTIRKRAEELDDIIKQINTIVS